MIKKGLKYPQKLDYHRVNSEIFHDYLIRLIFFLKKTMFFTKFVSQQK